MSHRLLFFYSDKDRKDYEKKKVFCNFFLSKRKANAVSEKEIVNYSKQYICTVKNQFCFLI